MIETNIIPEPNFKHGLKIVIAPTIDYNKEQFEVGNLIIQAPTAIVTKDIPEILVAKNWNTEMDSIVSRQLADKQTIANIILPKNTECGIITITQDCERNASYTVYITAEEGSSATVLINKKDTSSMSGEIIRVIAKPNSKVDIITAQQTTNTTIFSHRDAIVQRDATVHWTEILLGGTYVRSHTSNNLVDTGATGNITVLYLASKKQKFDIYTANIHSAPETNSNIISKGAITDSAKALSRGLVEISTSATNANGYEQQDALLLNETAEADAIPNLVIQNHNVKCSHGSTVGQVNKETLFYIMSRGIPKSKAERILIEGFFNPVIEKCSESVQETVRKTISEVL